MQAAKRTLLLALQVASFLLSVDHQHFNDSHGAETGALGVVAAFVAAASAVNWVAGAVCAAYESFVAFPGRRRRCWHVREPYPPTDEVVARLREVNTAASIPVSIAFVLITATEIYADVLGTYPRDKSWTMLAVNAVLFLSARDLASAGTASERRA